MKILSINIGFNAKTGELVSLNCNWENSISVPSTSNPISTDAAKKIFLSYNIPQFMYMMVPKDSTSENSEEEIRLVYCINNLYGDSTYVDAITGKLLNHWGQELDDNFSNFQNIIKGSSVEKEANILASNGIIDPNSFKLDGTITNLQFIKILTNTKNLNRYYTNDSVDLKISTSIPKNSADYKYLQLAVRAGILDNSGEFKASDLVTRKQASISSEFTFPGELSEGACARGCYIFLGMRFFYLEAYIQVKKYYRGLPSIILFLAAPLHIL